MGYGTRHLVVGLLEVVFQLPRMNACLYVRICCLLLCADQQFLENLPFLALNFASRHHYCVLNIR